MKSVRFFFSILLLIPMIVFADKNDEYIINNNNIKINGEEYADLLKIHSEEYIMNMTKDRYDHLKQFDFNSIKKEEKYIITTYNPHLNISVDKEICKEEYEKLSEEELRLSNGSVTAQTTAKKISMSVMQGGNWDYVNLDLTWKVVPSVRSYDVIGLRLDGLSVRNGSQQGQQLYYSNNQWNYINYSWNGTNIKKFNNGFGISMNLVDNSLSRLQLSIECDVKTTANAGSINGSYQHAVANLSLADSKNYTLSGNGLGHVFLYPYNIAQKYDGMAGVRILF